MEADGLADLPSRQHFVYPDLPDHRAVEEERDTIKAWDVFNNSSEVTISFEVRKMVVNVYPNPFREEVKVEFKTSLIDLPLTANLEVYNINGSLVCRTISSEFLHQGYKEGILSWDGRTAAGSTVPPGLYLIVLKLSDGKSEIIKSGRVVKVK